MASRIFKCDRAQYIHYIITVFDGIDSRPSWSQVTKAKDIYLQSRLTILFLRVAATAADLYSITFPTAVKVDIFSIRHHYFSLNPCGFRCFWRFWLCRILQKL